MKKCSYCAKEIQDKDIKCRLCGKWLVSKAEIDKQMMADFFAGPDKYSKDARDCNDGFSPLYLLRSDVKNCLEGKPKDKSIDEAKPRTTWLATMGVYAGIDLLGKFYTGKDNRSKKDWGVKDEENEARDSVRFKKFLKDFLDLEPDEAKLVYKHRCALMHSFGTFIMHEGTPYRIMVNQEADLPIVKIKKVEKVVIISIIKLYEQFGPAIEKYYKRLKKDPDLQRNFLRMYPDYGSIEMP